MWRWFAVSFFLLSGLAGLARAAPAGGAPSAGPRMANTGAHGDLRLALSGHALVARLVLPAEQVVGFQHKPASDQERMAVTNALARLGKAENVLVPLPEARCTIARQEALSALAPPRSAQTAGVDHGKRPEDNNFHARYAWHCDNPGALLAVDVPLLSFINGMALDTLVITKQGPRSRTLRAPQTRLPVVRQ